MNALRDGIRRVNDAPAILFGVWLLQLGIGVLLGRAPALADPLGPFDVVWAAYLAAWLFLAGGMIDRYARDRPTRSDGFFAASGVFFFRFLRLAIVFSIPMTLLFWVRFRLPLAISFEGISYAVIAVKLVSEYAMVRSVIEDRRSMINSIAAAVRFIVGNPGRVAILFLAQSALSFIVSAAPVVFVMTTPAADGTSVDAWSRFVAGQLVALAGVWVMLVGWASKASLYQSRLAHAGYVARTQPAWPESPAAEAITASARSRS